MTPQPSENKEINFEDREKALLKMKFCILQNHKSFASKNRLQCFVLDIDPNNY